MRRCEERSKRGLQVFKDMWGKVLGGGGGFTEWVTREECWHLGASVCSRTLSSAVFFRETQNFWKWRQSCNCNWYNLVFMSPAGLTFALKLSHLNQDFEEYGGSRNVPLHICFLHQPPSSLSSSLLSVWASCRALQCHCYDRSTLSAQEIPLFVCSPPKGVKLSSWQLTRPLVLSRSLSLSLSLSLSVSV